MRILAVSGSLRAASTNTSLLRVAAVLAPPDVEVALWGGLADIPPFNPDLEEDPPAPPVADLRTRIDAADGLLISSPEYAHGVPGVLKNALDWLVGGSEIVEKPVALWNASATATHAQASLVEILTVMSAHLVAEASVTVPLASSRLDEATLLADPAVTGALRAALEAFARVLRAREERRGTPAA